MKAIHFILLLLLFSSCSSAQYFKVIEATHTIAIGGLQGARSENFNIMIKDNPQLDIKYLLVGDTEIVLKKKIRMALPICKEYIFPKARNTLL